MKVLGFVYRYSRGIQAVLEELKESGNGEAEFNLNLGTAFLVIEQLSIYSKSEKGYGTHNEIANGKSDPIKNSNDTLNDTLKLSETQRKVVDLIKKNKTITHLAISHALGVTEITAKRITKSLKESGILKRAGSGKSGYWEIIDVTKK